MDVYVQDYSIARKPGLSGKTVLNRQHRTAPKDIAISVLPNDTGWKVAAPIAYFPAIATHVPVTRLDEWPLIPQKIMAHSLQPLLCQSSHEHGDERGGGGGQCGKKIHIHAAGHNANASHSDRRPLRRLFSCCALSTLRLEISAKEIARLAKFIDQYQRRRGLFRASKPRSRFYENTTKVNGVSGGAYLAAESSWVLGG